MGLPKPSRETKISGTNADRGIVIFPVQLTMSRLGNLTRLTHTLAICVTMYTYIHKHTHTHTHTHTHEGAQDRNRNGDGSGDGSGDGAGTGTGTGTGVGIRRRTPDGNGDVSEDCSGDGNGDNDNGNENGTGEGRRGTKKRKKPQNSCRRRAGNGGDMGGKQKKYRKERVGSVAAHSDNLGSNKEVGGGAQGAQGSSKICTSRESVSPLSRLIRGFRNKYH